MPFTRTIDVIKVIGLGVSRNSGNRLFDGFGEQFLSTQHCKENARFL